MRQVDFDRVARVYQPLERMVFGRALQRARCAFLDALPEQGKVLLLGDGDGRYLKEALRTRSRLRFLSLDSSAVMLDKSKSGLSTGQRERVEFVHSSVQKWLDANASLRSAEFDVVVTHFFLDCFSDREVQQLAMAISPLLRPEGRWVVAEFQLPSSRWWWRWGGAGLLAVMYGFFRVASGLRARRLPDYTGALQQAGLEADSSEQFKAWNGLLTAELWRLPS